MKPCDFRGASAIYYFGKDGGILMDTAEGSYGQIYDHFGDEKVSEVLLKTKVIFITHIHGDHSLGVIKMMHERDILLSTHEKTPMYIVAPVPILDWIKTF